MKFSFSEKALPLGELARERLRGQAQCDRASLQRYTGSLSKPYYRHAYASLAASLPSPSLLRNATARVAAPSVCFAAARILLAAAPTAPPCFRHWRRSVRLPPKGEPLAGRSTRTGRASFSFFENVVLRCLGQRQLDKVRCPEVSALCSKALPFASYQTFSGQLKVSRLANGSPSGRAVCEAD